MTPRILSKHYGRAFHEANGLEGKPVAGNPAEIIFCENGLPSRDDMAAIARQSQSGIVTFLRQHAEAEFSVRFYFSDGEDTFLCGHGSIAAAYFIHKHFHYTHITLKHEHDFEIRCEVDARKSAKVYLPAYALEPMAGGKLAIYRELLGLGADDIADEFYCPTLKDHLLVLRDCAKLRGMHPDYDALSARIRQDGDRALMITAASQNSVIDYEIRVFCPYVDQHEDISCGSANCYLLPYWKRALTHKRADENLAILCPFKPNSEFFGGIEFGDYHPGENRISISGLIDEFGSAGLAPVERWFKSA